MKLTYKPTSIDGRRVTPDSIKEIAEWWCVRGVIKGAEYPPLEQAVQFESKGGLTETALIGDWILRDRDNQYSVVSHQFVLQNFDGLTNEFAEFDRHLRNRGRIEPQYGLTEDQTLVLANLQALKKLVKPGDVSLYRIEALPDSADLWRVVAFNGEQKNGLNTIHTVSLLRDLRTDLLRHVLSLMALERRDPTHSTPFFVSWQALSRAEQERLFARVINPNKQVEAPDEHELQYVHNHFAVASALHEGMEFQHGILGRHLLHQGGWEVFPFARTPLDKPVIYSQSQAESHALKAAVAMSPYMRTGTATEFNNLSCVERERLVGLAIEDMRSGSISDKVKTTSRPVQ